MTKKRFLSIILTVLMVLSIVPVPTAHAVDPYVGPCVGVAKEAIPVYENVWSGTIVYTFQKGQSFTIMEKVDLDLTTHYYKISYNTPASEASRNGIEGYITKDSLRKANVIFGSMGTVNYNVSVYYGPDTKYQRCGTLYAGETIAVLERGGGYSYIEYNDNVHGKRKRAYVKSEAITVKDNLMLDREKLPIQDENNKYAQEMCYVGLKYTVYSGPSTEYEPVGSVSDMHIYWVKRYTNTEIDKPFYDMLYIRYQVTGTNTWKSGYIVFNYKDAVGCPKPCTLHPGK